MQAHKTVSRDQWLEARRALLAKEKAHLRAHDELARQPRELPWVKVDKSYVFDGPDGRETLADVARGIHDKLVYRHPHVFAALEVDGTAAVLANWEELKAAEKSVWGFGGVVQAARRMPINSRRRSADMPSILYTDPVAGV